MKNKKNNIYIILDFDKFITYYNKLVTFLEKNSRRDIKYDKSLLIRNISDSNIKRKAIVNICKYHKVTNVEYYIDLNDYSHYSDSYIFDYICNFYDPVIINYSRYDFYVFEFEKYNNERNEI